jgi:hypothetical protein
MPICFLDIKRITALSLFFQNNKRNFWNLYASAFAKNRSRLWPNKWSSHRNNAPFHTALSVKQWCPTFLHTGAHLIDGCGGAGAVLRLE